LGTDAKKLEDQLSIIFQFGSRWNALLLLDEADVFLEQRTTENLIRHGLVSVFLRRLEYFRGILVLTTNRVENFDEAILSRIHIQLKYGELNADARRKVWKIFLGKAHTSCGAASISEKELGYLVRETLNDRQVGYL
jgi:SpoVK/Ycf46/Vps4 family AAA+-type ATPase